MSEVYARAQRSLARRDPVLRQLIRTVGPCTLRPIPDHFELLVRSIISQQISTGAARSIFNRVRTGPCGGTLSAPTLLAAAETDLRAAGLSAAKLRSLRHLAQMVHSGDLLFHDLDSCSDEEVIERLLPVRGIGRWTAQMFLIFSLGRLDVLPVVDLGLRTGVQRQYQLPELPDRKKLEELGEKWQPYRTIATWYIWRSLGPVPASD